MLFPTTVLLSIAFFCCLIFLVVRCYKEERETTKLGSKAKMVGFQKACGQGYGFSGECEQKA
jgi:hypothetical protein